MKTKIDNYTFDKTAKTVIFTDYTSIRLDGVLLIVNVISNVIVYNFADPSKGGTVASNVLTLDFDTSSMNNADNLLIYYDDTSVSLATSEDISNKDIMIALKALILAVANPNYVDKSSNQLRTQVLGTVTVAGTVTSSTTLTAVNNLVAMGGYQGQVLPIHENMMAWNLCVRNKIY